MKYIPITDILKNGKFLLKGYIRRNDKEDLVTLIYPLKFNDYDDIEDFIRKYDKIDRV